MEDFLYDFLYDLHYTFEEIWENILYFFSNPKLIWILDKYEPNRTSYYFMVGSLISLALIILYKIRNKIFPDPFFIVVTSITLLIALNSRINNVKIDKESFFSNGILEYKDESVIYTSISETYFYADNGRYSGNSSSHSKVSVKSVNLLQGKIIWETDLRITSWVEEFTFFEYDDKIVAAIFDNWGRNNDFYYILDKESGAILDFSEEEIKQIVADNSKGILQGYRFRARRGIGSNNENYNYPLNIIESKVIPSKSPGESLAFINNEFDENGYIPYPRGDYSSYYIHIITQNGNLPLEEWGDSRYMYFLVNNTGGPYIDEYNNNEPDDGLEYSGAIRHDYVREDAIPFEYGGNYFLYIYEDYCSKIMAFNPETYEINWKTQIHHYETFPMGYIFLEEGYLVFLFDDYINNTKFAVADLNSGTSAIYDARHDKVYFDTNLN